MTRSGWREEGWPYLNYLGSIGGIHTWDKHCHPGGLSHRHLSLAHALCRGGWQRRIGGEREGGGEEGKREGRDSSRIFIRQITEMRELRYIDAHPR